MKTDIEVQETQDYIYYKGKRLVTMSNALTIAGTTLTLSEKRIIAIAVSKVDSRKKLMPDDLTIKVTAKEYAELAQVDTSVAYKQLQTASKQLYERSIHFYQPAKNRKGKAIEPAKGHMRWISRAHYHDKEGWIELDWSVGIIQHISNLQTKFTSYKLEQASALRSIYSWRLLELLQRFKGSGWAEYAIEDLHASMVCTEAQKKDFSTVRRKIIEPAVKELNQKDGWAIEWEAVKAGRSVRAVRFNFKKDEQLRLDI